MMKDRLRLFMSLFGRHSQSDFITWKEKNIATDGNTLYKRATGRPVSARGCAEEVSLTMINAAIT